MSLRLDHLVILVPDLDAAIAAWRQLGLNARFGGEHAGGQTHNALVGLADGSYLELIAFKRSDAPHRWLPWQQRAAWGLIDWALCPDDVARVVQQAGAAGLAYEGPFDSGRLRPDGVQLKWQMGHPPDNSLPFLCGDVTPRALRVPEGEVRVHANGCTGLASLSVVVRDLDAACARYRALLGDAGDAPRAATPTPISLAGLGLRMATMRLGGTDLVLLSPLPGEPANGSPGAAVAARLAERGDGPWALTLALAPGRTPPSLSARALPGLRLDFAVAAPPAQGG